MYNKHCFYISYQRLKTKVFRVNKAFHISPSQALIHEEMFSRLLECQQKYPNAQYRTQKLLVLKTRSYQTVFSMFFYTFSWYENRELVSNESR